MEGDERGTRKASTERFEKLTMKFDLKRFNKYLGFPPKTKTQTYFYLLVIGLILVMPYKNTSGGQITITAEGERKLEAPFEGELEQTINEENLNDLIKKGTLIARVQSDEIESNLKDIEEKIEGQKSKILAIRSEEDIDRKKLLMYKDLHENSIDKYEREYNLFVEGGVSYNKLIDAERQLDIDKSNVETQIAKIEQTGQQVKTAEYDLAQLNERKRYYDQQIKKADVRMPFDGFIYSQNLSSRDGSQVRGGDNIAHASKRLEYYGIMRVSENVIEGVDIGDNVEIRLAIKPLEPYKGKVYQIDRAVIANESKGQTSRNLESGDNVKIVKETTGKVVEVKVRITSDIDKILVPGLTGWAKIERKYVPLFWAYSQSLIRFIQLEVWSWFP